jgi:hypothetical protein
VGTSLGYLYHIPYALLSFSFSSLLTRFSSLGRISRNQSLHSFPPHPLSVVGDTVTGCIYTHFAGERSIIVSCASGFVLCLNAMKTDAHLHCEILWKRCFPQPVLAVRTTYFSGDGRGDLVITTANGVHITQIATQQAIATVFCPSGYYYCFNHLGSSKSVFDGKIGKTPYRLIKEQQQKKISREFGFVLLIDQIISQTCRRKYVLLPFSRIVLFSYIWCPHSGQNFPPLFLAPHSGQKLAAPAAAGSASKWPLGAILPGSCVGT